MDTAVTRRGGLDCAQYVGLQRTRLRSDKAIEPCSIRSFLHPL